MKNLHLLDSQTNNGNGEEKETQIDSSSSCSTPFVSAPSSPGRSGSSGLGFFYSAPASPMHFLLSTNNSVLTPPPPPCVATEVAGNEFDFDASCYPMSSADELFFNGQIRPMKQKKNLHLQLDDVQEVSDDHPRGRLELRNRSLRRVRSEENFQYDNNDDNDNDNNDDNDDDNGKLSGKKKSADVEGRPWLLRNSKRWVSLFLYRSKSEGRNNGRHKYFWSSVVKEKKLENESSYKNKQQQQEEVKEDKTRMKTKTKTRTKSRESCSNSQRLGLSAHYTANRAQSEEMRKKTYLPYRQGIFGCIGLNNPRPGPPASFNAFAARAFNSVSS